VTHKCFKAADKKLADKNTRLSMGTAVMYPAPRKMAFVARPVIETMKVDSARRGRPVTVMATYCPFCGVKL
jgi:hypothetical protein